MKKLLIDTNIYTAFKNGQTEVVDRLGYASQLVLCPTVTGELLSGFKLGSKETQNRVELETFLDNPRVATVTIDNETAEFYSEVYRSLRAKGRPIPTNDMWIAASAMQHGLAVCTMDRHFSGIEGLLLNLLA